MIKPWPSTGFWTFNGMVIGKQMMFLCADSGVAARSFGRDWFGPGGTLADMGEEAKEP
jgi:hypothetical protein